MLEEKKPFKASDGPMIVLIAFVAMLVGQVIFSVPLMIVSNSKAAEIINLIAMIAFQGIYLSAYFVYTKRRGIKSSFSFKNKISLPAVCATVIIAPICFFCFSGLSQLFELLLAQTGYVPSELEASGTWSIILLVIVTVIVAPIGEETIFRSALVSGVEKTNVGDLCACLLSGLLFALMHVNPSQTVYQFCLGSAAAYVMLKFRNVIAAMIIHSISNLLAILLSLTDVGLKISTFYVEQIGHNVLVSLVFCLILPVIAVALIWFICKFVKEYERKKYPDKYNRVRPVWIDENNRPVYEGDGVEFDAKIPIEEIVMRQEQSQREYIALSGEKGGFFGKKTYEITLGLYIALTAVLWLATLITRL